MSPACEPWRMTSRSVPAWRRAEAIPRWPKRSSNALTWHCAVPLDAIQATVDEGQVTLTGAVTWAFQKAAAELAVQQLPGVKSVTNNIIVKPQASVEDVKATDRAGVPGQRGHRRAERPRGNPRRRRRPDGHRPFGK